MAEQLWYLRDASWHHRPSTTGPKKYHLPRPGDEALALCRDAVLSETTVRREDLLSEADKCRSCVRAAVKRA